MAKQPSKTPSNAEPISDPLGNLTYEEALQQLEAIMDTMNGSVPLAESVTLYERADRLLHHCSQKLGDAESKIELLMKNRAGEIALGGDGRPQVQPFAPQQVPKKVAEPSQDFTF